MVLNPRRWPPLDKTTLNDSQMAAVQTALTKELAIIQGPPGTGKTYVGLKVTQVLLDNQEVWTPPDSDSKPILVVCYTNHALDQFLEGILQFCPEGIVRVGSRCNNPALEDFNLKNLRRKMQVEKKTSLSIRNSIRDCARELTEQRMKIENVSAKLEASTKGVVSATALKDHMPEIHFNSLMKKEFYTAPPCKDVSTVMVEWLSNGLITQGPEEREETDSYAMLAQEVTSLILQGEEVCQESKVDVTDVQFVSPVMRAQLYRFWLRKATTLLEKDTRIKDTDPQPAVNAISPDSRRWLRDAKRDILPDSVLQRVVNPRLFAAITEPLQRQHQQQSHYLIRAWLGVSEMTSGKILKEVLQGREICVDRKFTPEQVVNVPAKTRVQMYRFWLQRLRQILQKESKLVAKDSDSINRILTMSNMEILPDSALQKVVSPLCFEAIRTEMTKRYQNQTHYMIKSWLGIHEFCQNPLELETILEQLEDSTGEAVDDAEEPEVDEEADVIQKSRHLDVDDDDDLFDFAKKKKPGLDVKSAMQELGVQTTLGSQAASSSQADADGFSLPKHQQKRQAKRLQSMLTSSVAMTLDEASSVRDVWSQELSVEKRMRLYLFWLRLYQNDLRQSVKEEADEYNQTSKQLRELRMGEEKSILEEAKVIGMTTTGAARYRPVLASVACPIIILEEAAEVLEAHVVTTLHKNCQHLILIGDHQQLKPSPTVYELCRHFHLDLSLFERLINNRLHHSTLQVQHRMRPEVARLVRHVYPELKDHGSTLGREHIRGVKQDVFLLQHEEHESHNNETTSKSNKHEAELCVGLCRYLLQQGYGADSITILTAYSGQLFAIKNIIKTNQNDFRGVRVTAVDNYQGEENDIIILSLVRSNSEGAVGFLGTDNRVCVALSRARNAFFAFGNFKILSASSELWKNICKTAKEHGQLGDKLVLRCENHPSQEVTIMTAKDFDKTPEGGCRLPCGYRLDTCGHVCELNCHGYDREHVKYRCRKKCERLSCPKGHSCSKQCYQDCGDCMTKVEKTIPMCGHVISMACSKDPHTALCKSQCQGTLSCGHPCTGTCTECRKQRKHVGKCLEQVERIWPCGHLVTSPCHVPVGELPCDKPCAASLACGHACKGTCGQCWGGRVHLACKEKCGLPLPGCGHKCRLPCGTLCLPCTAKCSTACKHSACKQLCGKPCLPCKEACPWKCKHQECESLCHRPCQPCPQPCEKKMKCGLADPEHEEDHVCRGFCGEKCVCWVCEHKSFVPLAIAGVMRAEESHVVKVDSVLVKLPRCGHVFNAKVLDVYVARKCLDLEAGEAVRCPLADCKKTIVEADCWRYAKHFRTRQDRFEAAKQDLEEASTVPASRRQKLLDSLKLLTHDAEQEKSFASKASVGQVLKKDGELNANAVFALTNQIKLAKVFEMTTSFLRKMAHYGFHASMEDTENVLKTLLFKPTHHLTIQRLQELRNRTKCFVYLSQLSIAKTFGTLAYDLFEKVEDYIDYLKKPEALGPSMETGVKSLVDKLQQRHPEYLTNSIDLSILKAHDEQDLCDVGKPFTPPKRKTTPAPSRPSSLGAVSLGRVGHIKPRMGPVTDDSPKPGEGPNPRSSASVYQGHASAVTPESSQLEATGTEFLSGACKPGLGEKPRVPPKPGKALNPMPLASSPNLDDYLASELEALQSDLSSKPLPGEKPIPAPRPSKMAYPENRPI